MADTQRRATRANLTGTRTRPTSVPPSHTTSNSGSNGGQKDYASPIKGLFQFVGFALLPIAPADACTIGIYAEPIAEATQELAFNDERIAAILDKLLEVGPYGKALGILMPMVLQFMANHNTYIKPGQLGTLTMDQLVTAVEHQQGGPDDASPGVSDIPTARTANGNVSDRSTNTATGHVPA